jgi:hypothetical protein
MPLNIEESFIQLEPTSVAKSRGIDKNQIHHRLDQ